jgi:hypothetical protein
VNADLTPEFAAAQPPLALPAEGSVVTINRDPHRAAKNQRAM